MSANQLQCSSLPETGTNTEVINAKKEDIASIHSECVSKMTISHQDCIHSDVESGNVECVDITYIDLKPVVDFADDSDYLSHVDDPLGGVGHEEFDQISTVANISGTNVQLNPEMETSGINEPFTAEQVSHGASGEPLPDARIRESSRLSEGTPVQFVCEICCQRFSKKSSLVKHVQRDHSGVKHNCEVSGITFPGKSSLSQQMRIHNREKTLL